MGTKDQTKAALKKWESLTISDDFLFSKIMRDQELCTRLLETILEVKISRVQLLEEQKTIGITTDAKSIRLDVYVEDGENTIYNVEMQTTNEHNLPKRSRYYQGMIDLNSIEKGAKYNELKKSFVIFICTFDPFGAGRHKYTFRHICEEDHRLRLEDDAAKVFLNAAGTKDDVSEELKNFLRYVAGEEMANDPLVQDLDRAVADAKANKDWRVEYMTLFLRDQENIEKGREEEKREIILNMLKESISLEMIAKVTQTTVDEVEMIRMENNL